LIYLQTFSSLTFCNDHGIARSPEMALDNQGTIFEKLGQINRKTGNSLQKLCLLHVIENEGIFRKNYCTLGLAEIRFRSDLTDILCYCINFSGGKGGG